MKVTPKARELEMLVAKLLKSNKNDYLQEIEQTLGRIVLVNSDPLMHQEKFDLA
jgi:ribonuclease G